MIGATPLTCETFQARAVARPFTLTVPSPNNFAKKPGCGFVTVTWIVSVSKSCLLNVIAVPLAPGDAPLFLPTYSLASDVARVVSGSPWAPASADASAVDWAARCALYQEPASMTSAAMPISTVRKTTVTTIDCPF